MPRPSVSGASSPSATTEQRRAEIQQRVYNVVSSPWKVLEVNGGEAGYEIVRTRSRHPGQDFVTVGDDGGGAFGSLSDATLAANAPDDLEFLLRELASVQRALADEKARRGAETVKLRITERELVARTAERDAYRKPCWEHEPENGDGGLPRVEWLAALLSEISEWIIKYPQILTENEDAEAVWVALRECVYLREGLEEAIQRERLVALGTPPGDAPAGHVHALNPDACNAWDFRAGAPGEATPSDQEKTMQMIGGFPRRIRTDYYSDAERRIRAAIETVERTGAHVRLTDAVVLLGQAMEAVADAIEDMGIAPTEPRPPKRTTEEADAFAVMDMDEIVDLHFSREGAEDAAGMLDVEPLYRRRRSSDPAPETPTREAP